MYCFDVDIKGQITGKRVEIKADQREQLAGLNTVILIPCLITLGHSPCACCHRSDLVTRSSGQRLATGR